MLNSRTVYHLLLVWFESSYCQRIKVSFLKRALRPPIATFTEEYRTSMIISNFCDLTSLRNRGRYPIFLSKQEKQRKISELLIQARLYVDFYYEKQVVCGCRNLTNQWYLLHFSHMRLPYGWKIPHETVHFWLDKKLVQLPGSRRLTQDRRRLSSYTHRIHFPSYSGFNSLYKSLYQTGGK